MPKLPNQYLKTSKNQILSDCSAGATTDNLWLYLKGWTLAEAADLAFDQESLERIEFHYGSLHTTFDGYTKATAVIDRGDRIEVRLAGGQVTEEDVKDERPVDGDGSDLVSTGDGSET